MIQDKKWIYECINFLKEIEKKDYIWTLEGYDSAKLSSASLFCKCAKIFENYNKFNYDKLKSTIDKYNVNNFYVDNTSVRDNIIAETRQALSGLINLNYDVKKIDLSKYYNDLDNLYFMNDNSWNNPWSAGAQLSHYLFFLKNNGENEKIKLVLNKLNKYKKHDGWYNNKPNDTIKINGIMKIFTGLDIIEYNYNQILDIIKTVTDHMLNINPTEGGCNLYDFVYVLSKSIKFNYRKKECQDKLLKIGNIILKYQHKDGGFSYHKNQTTVQIYGKICSPGKSIGGMHGTTLMCMALTIINKSCDLGLDLKIPIS